jgi:hypothetical protein
MTRKALFETIAMLTLGLIAGKGLAQQPGVTATYLGTQESLETGRATPRAYTVSPAAPSIQFNAAAVGIAPSAAQTLTATFNVSGNPGTPFTPTASLHYGLNFTVGTVTCSGPANSQTCTVPVTFLPTYPGARKDALTLLSGTTVLATVFLGGIGQGPLALVQPGVVTSPIANGNRYYYQSIVGEDGTVYVVGGSFIFSVTNAGVVTQLPITGLQGPSGIAIDGAGTLYIAQNTYSHQIITYTAAGVQGAITVNPPAPYVPCSNGGSLEYLLSVAVDQAGNLFAIETLCSNIFELKNDGTYAITPISPSITQPSTMAVDSTGNVFVGGYTINELTAGGVETQVNAVGASDGLGVDAADTLYATRYTGTGGVAELPVANYSAFQAALDTSAGPLGASVGPDGTVWVGNYSNLDKVDRSQGAISFGEQSSGTTSTAQTVGIYNGGNQPLNISNIAISGTGFALQSASTNNCSGGIMIAPGAFCQVAVTLTPPHAGTFSGSLVFTTNSLNTTSSTQSVALSGYVYGVYVTPSPTSLTFGSQTVGTTSAAQTITLTNNGDLYAAGIYTPVSGSSAFNVTLGTCTSALNVGSSCQLSVTFTPTAAQTYSNVSVSVPYVSSGGGTAPPPVTFTLNGTGTPAPAPIVSFSPTSIAFGSQAANTTSAASTIQVTNSGNATLNFTGITLTGANPADFAISANTCGTTLAAGATCSVSVTFTPASAASFSANLSFADNAAGSPQTVALTGTGSAALVATATITPNPLAFPATPVGLQSNAPTPMSLTNTGTAPLTISSISITGANASSFSETNLCGTTLAAGASCGITVVFSPTAAGALTANVSVADNATGSPQIAVLTGTGTVPQVTFTPTALNFGNQQVSTTSGPQSLTITNTGGAPLQITSELLTGPFNQITTCSTVIAAGASCTYTFSFTPLTTGAQTGSIVFTDNASGSPQTVPFTGTGTAAPAPQAVLTPTSLAFPSTTVGSTAAAQTLTLSNPGNATLNIASISLGGTNVADFIQTNTCGTALASGATCTISVTFTPASAAAFAATVNVSDNASGSPQSATVSGTGTAAPAPLAVLSPTSLAFPNTPVGTSSAALPITLSNPGNAALTIAGISIGGSNATSFTQTNTCGSSLAAGASCTINVTFSPAFLYLGLSATLTVSDNAAGSTQTASLTGTSTAPQAVLSPTSLTFASTTVGASAAAQTIALSNPGSAALTIGGISVTGANASSFTQSNTCGASLAAGASCTITVTFTPATTGSLSAAVSVADNASGSPQGAALTGTGASPLVPQAVLSPTTLAFPNTSAGTTSSALTATLSNPGNAPLTIAGITITGANAGSFSETTTCGSTVAAGATCTVSVVFSPTAAGSFSASLSVADNASGSPQTAALTGTAVASGTFAVSASTTTATVQPGGLAQYNLTVAAVGGVFNNLVTLSASGLPAGATASFAPPAVTPGSAGAPSTLSIQTATGLAHLSHPDFSSRPRAPLLALLAGLPLLGLAGSRRLRRNRRRWALFALAAASMLPALALSGCSGGYFGPAPKTYTVTVTGTSGAVQQSTTLTLTVQ